jgi:hypothetical protein
MIVSVILLLKHQIMLLELEVSASFLMLLL